MMFQLCQLLTSDPCRAQEPRASWVLFHARCQGFFPSPSLQNSTRLEDCQERGAKTESRSKRQDRGRWVCNDRSGFSLALAPRWLCYPKQLINLSWLLSSWPWIEVHSLCPLDGMSSGTFATGEFFSETQVISAAQSKRHLEDKNAPGFRRSPITHKINVLPKILLIFWVCRGVVGGFFF